MRVRNMFCKSINSNTNDIVKVVIEGKLVAGKQTEIKEVKNAFEAYDKWAKKQDSTNLDGTTNQVTNQVARVKSIFAFCAEPRSRDEIQQHIGISNRGYFRTNILKPLLEAGKLKMTIPDKPNSKNQKWV